MYGAQFGLSYVILRCANAYGPGQTGARGQGIIGRAITLEIWGDGTVVRDFVYVEDVAEAFLLAATTAAARGVVNIGSGKGTSVNEIIDPVGRVTGQHLPVTYTALRQLDVPTSVLEITKASSILNWSPTIPLVEGMNRCYAWARGHVHELATLDPQSVKGLTFPTASRYYVRATGGVRRLLGRDTLFRVHPSRRSVGRRAA